MIQETAGPGQWPQVPRPENYLQGRDTLAFRDESADTENLPNQPQPLCQGGQQFCPNHALPFWKALIQRPPQSKLRLPREKLATITQ